MLEFRRAAACPAEMVDRLATELPGPTGDRFRRHFRQQGAHLQHLVDGADAIGNLLANALQAYPPVSVRQNTDMRRISAWAAIWAVPTLVAGIYGMNFRHMPELSWRFGYPLVLVVMVAICLGLYRAFRHCGCSRPTPASRSSTRRPAGAPRLDVPPPCAVARGCRLVSRLTAQGRGARSEILEAPNAMRGARLPTRRPRWAPA